MKLKLDENVPQRVLPLLTRFAHDVMTCAAQGLSGCDDPTVFEAAGGEERMLVTLDVGFADIRRYPPGEGPGILVIRAHQQRPPVIEAILFALLLEYDLDDLAGCTIVAQPGAVRIRRPTNA